LGKIWGIVTKYTSFVAVENRKDAIEGTMKTIEVKKASKDAMAEELKPQINDIMMNLDSNRNRDSLGDISFGNSDKSLEETNAKPSGKRKSSSNVLGSLFGKLSNLRSGSSNSKKKQGEKEKEIPKEGISEEDQQVQQVSSEMMISGNEEEKRK